MAKVSIIGGAGRVGSTLALYLALEKLADKIVLVDIAKEKTKGIALDLQHAMPVYGNVTEVLAGNYEDTANSDIIVITAGLPRKAGMSREELLEANAKIVSDVSQNVAKYAPNTILIVVTNPLDVMCYVAARASGFPKNKVIGMAGILDTSRFKSFIAEKLKESNVVSSQIETIVLGSHGDEMIPLLSHTFVNKRALGDLLSENRIKELVERTRNAGAEIVKLQQDTSAYIAPAVAIVQMIDAILNDKKWILPCSAFVNGEYGLHNIYIGVPVVLGKNGVEKIIELRLNEEEKREFEKAASRIKELIARLKEKFKI